MTVPPLSRLTLGTAQFGGRYGIFNDSGCPDDEELAAILATAKQAAIAYLDTAAAYGDAEERLGRMLVARGDRAGWGKITKIAPLGQGASADEVDASLARSCARLRVERMEIVMFHRISDAFRDAGAGLDALERAVDKGAVGEIGVSIYTPQDAIRCLGDHRIRHLQLPFHILDRRWHQATFQQALAARPDVRVHARSTFLQGLLLAPPERWPAWVENRSAIVGGIVNCSKALGCRSRVELCLGFHASTPWIATSVVGVDSAAHLRMIIEAASGRRFEAEEMAMIAELALLVPERLLDPSRW